MIEWKKKTLVQKFRLFALYDCGENCLHDLIPFILKEIYSREWKSFKSFAFFK